MNKYIYNAHDFASVRQYRESNVFVIFLCKNFKSAKIIVRNICNMCVFVTVASFSARCVWYARGLYYWSVSLASVKLLDNYFSNRAKQSNCRTMEAVTTWFLQTLLYWNGSSLLSYCVWNLKKGKVFGKIGTLLNSFLFTVPCRL